IARAIAGPPWASRGPVIASGKSEACYSRHYHKLQIDLPGTTVHQHNEVGALFKMPARSEWLLRLPEIRAELEHLEVSVVIAVQISRLTAGRSGGSRCR